MLESELETVDGKLTRLYSFALVLVVLISLFLGAGLILFLMTCCGLYKHGRQEDSGAAQNSSNLNEAEENLIQDGRPALVEP